MKIRDGRWYRADDNAFFPSEWVADFHGHSGYSLAAPTSSTERGIMTTEKPLWETKPDGKIGPTVEGERVWAGARPALDLDAIRSDAELVAALSGRSSTAHQLAAGHVPALVAEVERLRAVEFEFTYERVERTARMLFARTHEGRNGFSWPLNGEIDRQRDLKDARAFLTRALGRAPSDIREAERG